MQKLKNAVGLPAIILGIPYDFWSLGLFAVIGLAAMQYMRRPMVA
jgi:hypothetical protein